MDITSIDQTDDVLETAVTTVGLDPNLTYYFGLYLVDEVTSSNKTVRRLQDFESPYVSLKRAEAHQRVSCCYCFGRYSCLDWICNYPILYLPQGGLWLSRFADCFCR